MPNLTSNKHPWDDIFATDGRVFTELLPVFHETVKRFSDNQIHNILDLGCGNGRHVLSFRKNGFNVTGFDRSPTGLKLTRDWLAEEGLTANLVEGDGRYNLPFQTAAFQGLISTQVIHHALISEIRLTISEIWRVLDDEGLAIITVAGKRHHDLAYQQIEPGTYLPLNGPEKGLPHHIFAEDELCQEFRKFKILELSPRDNGRVLAIWIKKTTAVN